MFTRNFSVMQLLPAKTTKKDSIVCVLCGGPIGMGEPVVIYENGLAHRFRTTCDWIKEEEAQRTQGEQLMRAR